MQTETMAGASPHKQARPIARRLIDHKIRMVGVVAVVCLIALVASRSWRTAGPTRADSIRRGDRLMARQQYAEAIRAAELLPDHLDANLLAASTMLTQQQRFLDVADRMSALLRTHPGDGRLLVMWGNATAHLRDSNWALYSLNGAIGNKSSYESARRDIRPPTSSSQDAEAEQAFRKAIELDPADVDAKLALANGLWAAGRPDDAEPYLRAVADEKGRGHGLANQALGRFYLARGRDSDGVRYLSIAAEAPAEYGRDARFTLVDYHMGVKQYDKTLAMLTSMLKDDDGDGEVTFRLATLQIRLGHTNIALQHLNSLLARFPTSNRAVVLKAQCLMRLGEFARALPLAREAVAREPRSREAKSTLGHVLLETGGIDEAFAELTEAFGLDPASAELPATLAQLAIRLDRREEALQFAQDAVRKNPGNLDAAVALVRTRIALQDYERAQAELGPLLARYPASHDLYAQLGELHLARGANADARAAFARALELHRYSKTALAGMVSLDLKERKIADARTRVDDAIAARPQDPEFLLLAAPVYVAGGDAPRAEATWRHALEIDPANERAALDLSQFLVGQTKYIESKRVLEQGLERRPQSVTVQTSLGRLLEQMGKPAEAQARYEKIVAQTARAPRAASRLAALLVDRNGNLDYALGLARSASQLLPDDPDVSDVLGWVYTRKNLPSLALPRARAAVRAVPSNAQYRFHLASAYLRAGQLPQARAEFTRALQIDPNFAEAPQARAALATLAL